MNPIISLFSSISQIPQDDMNTLSGICWIEEIKRNDFLVKAGSTPKTLAVVDKGLFRYYYTDDQGNEFTKGFFPEKMPVIAYSALLEDRPSYFSIQALEDSIIGQINFDKLNSRFGQTHWFKDVTIQLVQRAYCIKEERERQLLLYSAEERYKSFFTRFPGLDKRIKQHLIASFLGIKPETLSRIRKKMGLLI